MPSTSSRLAAFGPPASAFPALARTGCLLVGSGAALALAGCSLAGISAHPAPSTALHLTGSAHGGQQPVSAAAIQLYATGSAGNASAATPLLTTPVLTDGNGAFNITAGYTCPSASAQVYIVATGGNPGLPGNAINPALTLVTALGDCGTLPSVPNVSINEITTVAAAYALAPFASSVTAIGASATNSSGLRNAMQTAMMLADSYTGLTPSAHLAPNATVESAKLTSLANVLAGCVNSDGGAPCAQLFTHVAAGRFPAPSDTFAAALAITSNPGNNVATIFNDAPPQPAFGGALPQPPTDWTMSIAFTGGGLLFPTGLAIDPAGNVWVANYNSVSAFSAQGVPLAPAGYTGNGINQGLSVAIDSASNIWIGELSDPAQGNHGSITKLAPNGTVLSGQTGFTAGNIFGPWSLAADPAGSIWVANLNAGAALLATDGTPLSGPSGFGTSMLQNPEAIAVDNAHNVWIAQRGALVQMDANGNILQQVACCTYSDFMAIDSNGTIWLSDNAHDSLTKVLSGGSLVSTSISGGGLSAPSALSIDGADHLWVANGNGTISEFSHSAVVRLPSVALTSATGLGSDAHVTAPRGLGVDSSGSLWLSSRDNRLVTLVGLAVPVKTPKIGLPEQP